jgi:cell division protein FtsL
MNEEDENKFGSWRENLKNESEQRAGSREQEVGNSQHKPVDGMGHFVSKEGFVIDDSKQQTVNNKQQATTATPPKTTPPLKPQSKPSFPQWLKVLLLAVLAILILFTLYIFFIYKSTLDISVSTPDTKITLDNKSASAGINKVKPGKYDLKIEKEGFVAYAKKVEVKYFKKTNLSVVLKETPKIISIYNGKTNYLAYNKESDLYLFYVPEESAFFRIQADKINDQNSAAMLTCPHYLKNLINVIWNPDRLTAILKIKNDNAVLTGTPFYNPTIPEGAVMTYLYDFGRYDLLHQEAKFWGTGIGDLEFTPKGDQVAYYFEPGTGEKSLVVANKDNSAINRIADLRSFSNPLISWSPDLKNIVIVNRSTTAYETNKIYVFDLINKTLNTTSDSGNNLEAEFDSSGEKIVYSAYSSDPDFTNHSLLSIMDKDGKNKKELKLRSNIYQTAFNSTSELLALAEEEKDNYSLVSINLSDLKTTDYTFSGKIIAPTSIEYIEAKNSIIFVDQNKANLLFLTSNNYE